jgi:hypothetical protein
MIAYFYFYFYFKAILLDPPGRHSASLPTLPPTSPDRQQADDPPSGNCSSAESESSCSHSRDEGKLVAFNAENNNTTEGTLVAFKPGGEASLAFRSHSRSRSPRREEEGLPGTNYQSLLRALKPPAKVSPPQPVPRKKRDYHESVLASEPAPETLFYSDDGVAIPPLYSPDFSDPTILAMPKSPSTSQRGKKKAPPSK